MQNISLCPYVPICARVFKNKKVIENPKNTDTKLEKTPLRQNKALQVNQNGKIKVMN